MNKNRNDRWVLIGPEEMKDDQWYAITLNCAEELAVTGLFERYIAVFQKLVKFAEIKVLPEFSKKMKLHYHGWFKPRSIDHVLPLYTLLNDIRKNFSYCVKVIDDEKKWEEYCTKQRIMCMTYLQKTYKLHYQIDDDYMKKNKITAFIDARDELMYGVD